MTSQSCCLLELKKSMNDSGKRRIRIALAGNANVGKSALFNYLTGMSQHVANWPGKTVELAEGTFCYKNCEVSIVDLPGIYSFSSFSKEEEITKEYILTEKPDVVVNVVNSCALERNLLFTTQLLELGVPVVVALNQTDIAKHKGININEKELSIELGVPVVKIIAINGMGVAGLVKACLLSAGRKDHLRKTTSKKPLASEHYYKISEQIVAKVQTKTEPKIGFAEKIDELTMHWLFGYLIMFLVLGIIFYSIFTFGSIASSWASGLFDAFRPAGDISKNIVWEGLVGGFVAGITLVLPYVLPFYLLLTILEDSGYITRIAYLLDGFAHRVGFHGKAVIPLILGYGCNVPACFACRIMEYDRDRLITAFAITLVPCTARTVVILALVGAYLGAKWAIALYILNIIVVGLLAKIAFKTIPGEPVGLIMEMSDYRLPSIRTLAKHTWWKIKSILSVVFPYYIGGGFIFAIIYLLGVFNPLNDLLSPITVGWLGLPAFTATLLVFGIVRKELIVVLPAVIFGISDLGLAFTPVQMIVLTIVAMFYVPCLATIEALKREFGLKQAFAISVFDLVFAIFLGGIALRFLQFIGIGV